MSTDREKALKEAFDQLWRYFLVVSFISVWFMALAVWGWLR